MAHFRLLKVQPTIVDAGLGTLDITAAGAATFYLDGETSHLERVRIEWAGADGILLSGLEPAGADRGGRAKYLHQEWMLKYIQPT